MRCRNIVMIIFIFLVCVCFVIVRFECVVCFLLFVLVKFGVNVILGVLLVVCKVGVVYKVR